MVLCDITIIDGVSPLRLLTRKALGYHPHSILGNFWPLFWVKASAL